MTPLRTLGLLALIVACSDSTSPPASVEPARTQTPPEASPTQDEPPPAESEVAEPTEDAVHAAPVRAPENRVLPELSSVRWGPERRDAFETLEAVDAMVREHLGRPARVALRMRARHGRERMTLAVVLVLKTGLDELEPDFVDAMLRFDGPAITEEELAVDRREGEADARDEHPCRCDGEVRADLVLVRIVHSEDSRIDHIELPASVCSGRSAELRLADFDRDGRVEVRADIAYHTDVSCGAQSEVLARLYVVDIADLVLQSSMPTVHDQQHYFTESTLSTRARFTSLDEDEHPDIEIVGRGSHGEDGSEEDPLRFAVRQSWLYDIASDSWIKQIAQ